MRKRIILLFLISLCLFAFLLTGCNFNKKPSNDIPNYSEDSWSDENVDNDGWT